MITVISWDERCLLRLAALLALIEEDRSRETPVFGYPELMRWRHRLITNEFPPSLMRERARLAIGDRLAELLDCDPMLIPGAPEAPDDLAALEELPPGPPEDRLHRWG
jgi:hypothetical protein